MRIYLAPMEGNTGYVFRNAVHACFGGFDKYFMPFIRSKQSGGLTAKEKKDLLPEHNRGMYAVPQIMTRHAEEFTETARILKEHYGYEEVNLNLGCPSGTVTAKGRGAGFLAHPEELEIFLDEIFERCTVKISVKTRLGMEDPAEFERLLAIYNRFPMEELIIHPRVRTDFYKNAPNLEAFGKAYRGSRQALCYNGNICSAADCAGIAERFPNLAAVMAGRGVLANPALGRELAGGRPADKEEIRRFHDLLYGTYRRELQEPNNALHPMKELWTYLMPLFEDEKRYAKKIKKCRDCAEYESAAAELFADGALKKEGEVHGIQF